MLFTRSKQKPSSPERHDGARGSGSTELPSQGPRGLRNPPTPPPLRPSIHPLLLHRSPKTFCRDKVRRRGWNSLTRPRRVYRRRTGGAPACAHEKEVNKCRASFQPAAAITPHEVRMAAAQPAERRARRSVTPGSVPNQRVKADSRAARSMSPPDKKKTKQRQRRRQRAVHSPKTFQQRISQIHMQSR